MKHTIEIDDKTLLEVLKTHPDIGHMELSDLERVMTVDFSYEDLMTWAQLRIPPYELEILTRKALILTMEDKIYEYQTHPSCNKRELKIYLDRREINDIQRSLATSTKALPTIHHVKIVDYALKDYVRLVTLAHAGEMDNNDN